MNTSERIKHYLKQHQPTGVDQISRALDLTKADIHYHIRQLIDRGEIVVNHQKMHSPAPGRPARQYRLVESVPIATTRLILSVFLVELLGNTLSSERTLTISKQIAEVTLSRCPSYRNVILSPSVRLNRIINELIPLGLNLSWEAGKNGPVIRIQKEPFSTIFQDRIMIESILQSLILLMKKNIA